MAHTEHAIVGDPRGQAPGPPHHRGRAWVWVAGIVALAVLSLAVWVATRDDDSDPVSGGDTTMPTTAPSTTTTAPTTTTVVPAEADSSVLWPFPGAGTRFSTPEDAARSFATEFLRFESPVLAPFQQGDVRSGEVPIRPAAKGPVTTILVRQVGPGDDWSVLGAVSDHIEVTTPAPGDEIASPVSVAGSAWAFEGNVQVEVRQDGELGAIGAGFVTGGGDQMRPFTGSIAFETPGAPLGALVFFTESAENGQVWEASTLRVALRSTDSDAVACGAYRAPRLRPAADEMEVKAYFNCDAASEEVSPFPVHRLAPESPRLLEASLKALLAGPTAEERDASISSWFSAATSGMLRSVVITDGHAVVDLGDLRSVIPNASTSAGSALLLAQLDATVFQFRSVESAEYRLQGSCEAFNEWLQYGGCGPRMRGTSTD
jgi:hypothetical protein